MKDEDNIWVAMILIMILKLLSLFVFATFLASLLVTKVF